MRASLLLVAAATAAAAAAAADTVGCAGVGGGDDDDDAVRRFAADVQPIQGKSVVGSCAEALALLPVLCTDEHGPYRVLRAACNSTCRACAHGFLSTSCEDHGLGDDDDGYQRANGFAWRSCRWKTSALGGAAACRKADPRTADEFGVIAVDDTYLGLMAEICPVACGFCQSSKLTATRQHPLDQLPDDMYPAGGPVLLAGPAQPPSPRWGSSCGAAGSLLRAGRDARQRS